MKKISNLPQAGIFLLLSKRMEWENIDFSLFLILLALE